MLLLRGLWWRRGFAVAVLACGLAAITVVALGPLYARAAAESTLTDELRAGGAATSLDVTAATVGGDSSAPARVQGQLGPTTAIAGFGPAVTGLSMAITGRSSGAAYSTGSTMVSRSGQCAHLTLVAGTCPSAPGDAIVDEQSRDEGPRWQLGQTLTVRQGISTPDGVVDGPVVGSVRVVGVYRPVDTEEAYWSGLPYFNTRLGPAADAAKQGVDAVFVTPAQFAALPPQVDSDPIGVEVDVDIPLDAGRVHLDDLPALRSSVAAAQRRFPPLSSPPTPELLTGLSGVLADAARDRRQVDTATTVVVAELVALCLLVLFQVVTAAVDGRRDEIALATLRGLPPTRLVWFALAEPVTLLLLATVGGIPLAVVLTHVLARAFLVGGTPVVVPAAAVIAGLAALGATAAASGLAAARTLRRPVLEQWRGTVRSRAPWRGVAFDLLLATAAVIAVVALRRADSPPSTVLLLAPALLVYAIGLGGARLLPLTTRLAVGATRASRRIGVFLAVRQAARRPVATRLAALLAVAGGLAVFAVSGEAVAAGNRQARARTEVAAPQVLSVQFETAHDPEAAVAAADPDGRWAMAAASWSPDGGPGTATIIGELLGVQPARLASTAYAVRGQLPPAQIAPQITAPTAPPAVFRARTLSINLQTTALAGDRPTVELGVRPTHGRPVYLSAGELHPGAATYSAAVDCAAGCAFAGVTFDRSITATGLVTGTATLSAVTADGQTVPVRLNDAASWRSGALGDDAGVQVRPAASSGLDLEFRSTGASSPLLLYADSPDVVPIVAAPSALTEGGDGEVDDYSDAQLKYSVRQEVSPLPGVVGAGAIADLDYLRERLPGFDFESSWAVWLGPAAPPDAQRRLTAAGLIVQGRSTETARVAALSREGPALGLRLLLVCAAAAAVLALGGSALALLADARRRRFELAALRLLGVGKGALTRAAVGEQLLTLGAGSLLGVAGGWVAAATTLAAVPMFSDATPVVLRFTPSAVVVLLTAAVMAALLTVAATAIGPALVRGAEPERLREVVR